MTAVAMDLTEFYVEERPDQQTLVAWASRLFGVAAGEIQFARRAEDWRDDVGVRLDVRAKKGGFRYSVWVRTSGEDDPGVDLEAGISELSQRLQTRILGDDGGVDPYLYRLFLPDGTSRVIGVDADALDEREIIRPQPPKPRPLPEELRQRSVAPRPEPLQKGLSDALEFLMNDAPLDLPQSDEEQSTAAKLRAAVMSDRPQAAAITAAIADVERTWRKEVLAGHGTTAALVDVARAKLALLDNEADAPVV